MTPTAPRTCPYCMYRFTIFGYPDDPQCGRTNNPVPDANTCTRWSIGYAGRKFEADAIRAEREERARRKAAEPVQLSFDDQTRINSDPDIGEENKR